MSTGGVGPAPVTDENSDFECSSHGTQDEFVNEWLTDLAIGHEVETPSTAPIIPTPEIEREEVISDWISDLEKEHALVVRNRDTSADANTKICMEIPIDRALDRILLGRAVTYLPVPVFIKMNSMVKFMTAKFQKLGSVYAWRFVTCCNEAVAGYYMPVSSDVDRLCQDHSPYTILVVNTIEHWAPNRKSYLKNIEMAEVLSSHLNDCLTSEIQGEIPYRLLILVDGNSI